VKTIPLTRGFVAWVDDDDYERLSKYKWTAARRGGRTYAFRAPWGARGVYMHREIMGDPPGVQIDHIKHRHSELVVDNRKSNLRLAPGYTNKQSTSKRSDSMHSPFKGVRKGRGPRPWVAFITCNRVRKHIGSFSVEAHAALAYDLAAVRSFGEFALTNFPVLGSVNWIFGPDEGAP
jgi:hypothetical protein